MEDRCTTRRREVRALIRARFSLVDTLPDHVAHSVAHCNAERLWGVPPQGGWEAFWQCLIAEIFRSTLGSSAGSGLLHAFEASAGAARESFLRGDVDAARGQLRAFIKKVGAQAGKKISEDDAARVTNLAQQLLDRL